MKSLTEVLATLLLACSVAAAQGAPAGAPKPDQTRQTPPDRDSSQAIPGQGTSSTNQGTGSNQDGSTPSTASDSSATDESHTSADDAAKSGKKLKGCIRSESGKYVLETTHDKMVSLAGSEDFGPHVGHTVTVHGRFVQGQKSTGPMSEHSGMSNGDMSGTSGSKSPSGTSSGGDQSDASSPRFQVTKMEMVSDSCTLDGKNGTKSE
jgi:hypothetical protein